MASCVNRVDASVKEYLLFRGFATALKGLEYDLRNDKDKGFRPDLIIDQLLVHTQNFELLRLLDYWSYLDRRMFSRLEVQHQSSTRKLYSSLLKYYLVNTIQSGRSDKVQEFFEKMTPELHGQSEWKDWFAIPFMKQPESVPGFEVYFSKLWQEALVLSLHNYLTVTMQCMPLPALLSMADFAGWVTDEKDVSARRSTNEVNSNNADWNRRRHEPRGFAELKGSVELMDDFYHLTQTMAPLEDATAASRSSLNIKPSIMKTFRGNSSSSSSGAKPTIHKPKTRSAVLSAQGTAGSPGGHQPALAAVPSATVDRLSSVLNQLPLQKPAHSNLTAASAIAGGSSNAGGSSGSSSGSGGALSEHETDRKKPSFLESLIRRSTSDAPKVETISDEAELPLCNVASTTVGEGVAKPPAVPATVKRISVYGDDYSDLLVTSPFHLLSQEEYSEHGSSAVTHCKFSKSGHAIVSADTSAVVKVWTLNPSPVTLASILAKSAVVSIEWVDPSDKLLLMGCMPDIIRIYDVKEKRTVGDKSMSNELFTSKLMAVSVDPAGSKFACSSSQTVGGKDSGELMFWDLRTMEREQGLGDNVSITAMTYSHDGRLLIAGCADGSMRIVDITSGTWVRRWNAHNGRVCSLYVSQTGTSCYTVGYDSRLYQWSLIGSLNERLSAMSLHESAAGPFSWSLGDGVTGAGRSPNPPVVHVPKDRLFVLNSRETHLLSCGSRGGCIYKIDKEGLLDKTMVLGGHRAPVVAIDWSGVDTETCLTADMAGKVRLSTLLAKEPGHR